MSEEEAEAEKTEWSKTGKETLDCSDAAPMAAHKYTLQFYDYIYSQS